MLTVIFFLMLAPTPKLVTITQPKPAQAKPKRVYRPVVLGVAVPVQTTRMAVEVLR